MIKEMMYDATLTNVLNHRFLYSKTYCFHVKLFLLFIHSLLHFFNSRLLYAIFYNYTGLLRLANIFIFVSIDFSGLNITFN